MPFPIYREAVNKTGPLVKEMIAVAAGKGGVGKSTVAVNLALALKKMGFTVGILDIDLYGPSLKRMLPEKNPPRMEGEVIFPAIGFDMPLMSLAYFSPDHQSTAVRAPIANRMIMQFISQVKWPPLDFLIIDFPPGTGDIQITLCQQVPLSGALMVTTPQEVAVQDVRRAIDLFEKLQVPLIGVIENMSYYLDPKSLEKVYLFGKGAGERLASQTGIPLVGSIPIASEVSFASDNGISLIEKYSESLAAKAYESIAEQFLLQLKGLKLQKAEGLSSFELIWKEG